MAPPCCRYPGCLTNCSVLSASQRKRWEESDGVAWAWQTTKLAYFMLCEQHHRQIWPQDNRTNNRHSRPGGSCFARNVRDSVRRLNSGDLYLTTSPPEYLDQRRVRSRSPVEHEGKGHTQTVTLPLGNCQAGGDTITSEPVEGKAVQKRRVHWADSGAWERQWWPSAGKALLSDAYSRTDEVLCDEHTHPLQSSNGSNTRERSFFTHRRNLASTWGL